MIVIMQMPDLEKLLTDYQAELEQDVKIDELSLKDKIMIVPTIKHKWVSRMMTHKMQLMKLETAKKMAIQNISSNSPIPLSKNSLDNAVGKDNSILVITSNIEQLTVIIEYLEKVEKLTGSITWDCKNLIDLQKLETT